MSASQPTVTVVSGMPRSGTSMMMQMLVAGGLVALTDDVRQADEDNRQGYLELEAVKRTKHDSAWLNEAAGKVVKVIYMLLYDLPPQFHYRVVFMCRDLEEVLASQAKMLERRGEQGANVSPEKLKAIFEDQLAKVERWIAQQPHMDVLYVPHREVLETPAVEAARVNEFLGGSLDVQAMTAVVDPDLYRQRSDP